MTLSSFAATPGPRTAASRMEYQPGVCNIGPAEIGRRRRAGHVGIIAAMALLAGLVAIGAPPLARLLVALPVAAQPPGTFRLG